MVGSSLLKRAYLQCRCRQDGSSLGLKNVDLWWQGYGGLRLRDVRQKLDTLEKVWDGPQPQYILLHCGANDIGAIPVRKILREIDAILEFINTRFPQSRVIWSQLLPRIVWRLSTNVIAMEKARKRVNSYGARYVLQNGGCYLLHPQLSAFNSELYDNDGVHLNFIGNNLFLDGLKSGLQVFLTNAADVHPKINQ